MSSWKKAAKVNQKVHRERHQPENRSHLGLLEKKKDYKQRADDFNKKKRVLKKLKIKALNRNPDEFYYHMVNSKLLDGKHKEIKKKDPQESIEQSKLLENRKSAYVTMKRTEEIKQIAKLQSTLHMVDIASEMNSSHIYFNDVEDGKKSKRLRKESESTDSSESELNEASNEEITEPTVPTTSTNIPDLDITTVRRLNRYTKKKYTELLKRINREKQLGIVHRSLELLNALKDTSAPRPKLVKEGNKNEAPIYLWKYQRKR